MRIASLGYKSLCIYLRTNLLMHITFCLCTSLDHHFKYPVPLLRRKYQLPLLRGSEMAATTKYFVRWTHRPPFALRLTEPRRSLQVAQP